MLDSGISSLGRSVHGTVQECLAQAGLDYDVKMSEVLFCADGFVDHQSYQQRYVTYRADTGHPFGVVKSHYQVIQNRVVYDFIDQIADFEITNAGHLNAGCWVCGHFKEEEILGDVFVPYLFFSNSHDGTRRFIMSFAPVRLTCNTCFNILPKIADGRFAVRHTHVADHKIKVAQLFAQQSVRAIDELRQLAQDTVSRKFTDVQRNEIYAKVLSSVRKNANGRLFQMDLQTLKSHEYTPQVLRFHGTGYGILLSVAHFVSHVLQERTKNKDLFFYHSLFQTSPYLAEAYKLVRE